MIRPSSAFNSRKIVTVLWTLKISLNISRKQRVPEDGRVTDKMTRQGGTEGAATGGVIEDRITRFTGAERSTGNAGDRVGENDVWLSVVVAAVVVFVTRLVGHLVTFICPLY